MIDTINNFSIVDGDILNCIDDIIVHQCNCISHGSAGLAKMIFTKWPEANIYRIRSTTSNPGTIHITPIENERFVVGIFGQINPGKPTLKETIEMRKEWFINGLEYLKQFIFIKTNLKSVAFPYKIGCGLAAGNWDDYLKMIQDLAKQLPNIKITIYKTYL